MSFKESLNQWKTAEATAAEARRALVTHIEQPESISRSEIETITALNEVATTRLREVIKASLVELPNSLQTSNPDF
jgi:hypothetical protein